jgi:hypothetical protein
VTHLFFASSDLSSILLYSSDRRFTIDARTSDKTLCKWHQRRACTTDGYFNRLLTSTVWLARYFDKTLCSVAVSLTSISAYPLGPSLSGLVSQLISYHTDQRLSHDEAIAYLP